MKIRSLAIRLAAFLGGLTGIVPSSLDEFGPVNRAKPRAKARMIDLGPRRDKNRYRPFRLEYPTDLPQFPVTRQVMRAELRSIALQDEKDRLDNWTRSRGKDKKHGLRAIARANVFPYINARGIDMLFNLNYRPGIRVWLERSGRPGVF